MAIFSAYEHPVLFALAVALASAGSAHLLWLLIDTRINFKRPSDRECTMYSIYVATGCIVLSWACIFLGQARPILSP
ncbi:hypothetical protein NEHOM01_0181 [Nematocida homosporus]|uniref:uncharacterized protein n=1 Tax=Nematocida homosporus TaxID=1912981 RepID=UPI00221F6AFB|nr:uncharacterized protein NEHOM01_0181 [Nematocida homosporus]KAI5184506.1 hypothetical protein NEHOM01_0181 [Nematocida homosporus]